jgi:hypothetical protein
MTTKVKPRKVSVIDLTDLVPEEWDWFWDMLNTASPDFSYGDNNLTLIFPERFAYFISDAYEWYSSGVNSESGEEIRPCTDEEWQAFIDKIGDLTKNDTYINVED